MEHKSIAEASAQLAVLVTRVEAGEEVIIEREGKLVAFGKPREGGQRKGRVQIADDFDELPPDIADAFGMN